MGDLIIQFAGSPDKHKELVSQINSWKYDIEGKVCKGKISPYIYETRTYIIRCPEEIEGLVLRDLEGHDPSERKDSVFNWKLRFLWKLYKFFLWFTPFHYVKSAEGKPLFFLSPWWYCVHLGKIKRKKVGILDGEEREVL